MIEYIIWGILLISVFIGGYLIGMQRFVHTAWRHNFIDRKHYKKYVQGLSKPQW